MIRALPKNEDGLVIVPVAGVVEQENGTLIRVQGTTTEANLVELFPVLASREVPLSDDDFQAVLSNCDPIWRENLLIWRGDGLV